MSDENCGDPYSGIGCPEPGCTHQPSWYGTDQPVTPNREALIAAADEALTPSADQCLTPDRCLFGAPDRIADALNRARQQGGEKADALIGGLRKAVKDDETEWVDANIIRLLLDRLARGGPNRKGEE